MRVSDCIANTCLAILISFCRDMVLLCSFTDVFGTVIAAVDTRTPQGLGSNSGPTNSSGPLRAIRRCAACFGNKGGRSRLSGSAKLAILSRWRVDWEVFYGKLALNLDQLVSHAFCLARLPRESSDGTFPVAASIISTAQRACFLDGTFAHPPAAYATSVCAIPHW